MDFEIFEVVIIECRHKYGFFGLGNTSSVFNGTEIDAPTLNISAFYLGHYFWGNSWRNPRTGQDYLFSDPAHTIWVAENQTYDMDYIKSYGSCQTVQVCQNLIIVS